MKKTIVGLTAALTIMFTGVAAGSTGYKFASSASLQEKVEINGGVIRLDPKKGVYLLTDSSHHSIGIEKVYINKKTGALVVEQDEKKPVVTTSVVPDETLSGMGVTVGLSGGGKTSQLIFYKNGKRLKLHYPSHYKQIATITSNIWFTSITK